MLKGFDKTLSLVWLCRWIDFFGVLIGGAVPPSLETKGTPSCAPSFARQVSSTGRSARVQCLANSANHP